MGGAMARRRTAEIDLLRVVDLLHEHLTAPLCHAAFKRVRRTERQRAWTLKALVQFWTAVVLPGALLGVYDLGRGLCRAVHFDPDAAASEFTRARTVVATLPRNTLVV